MNEHSQLCDSASLCTTYGLADGSCCSMTSDAGQKKIRCVASSTTAPQASDFAGCDQTCNAGAAMGLTTCDSSNSVTACCALSPKKYHQEGIAGCACAGVGHAMMSNTTQALIDQMCMMATLDKKACNDASVSMSQCCNSEPKKIRSQEDGDSGDNPTTKECACMGMDEYSMMINSPYTQSHIDTRCAITWDDCSTTNSSTCCEMSPMNIMTKNEEGLCGCSGPPDSTITQSNIDAFCSVNDQFEDCSSVTKTTCCAKSTKEYLMEMNGECQCLSLSLTQSVQGSQWSAQSAIDTWCADGSTPPPPTPAPTPAPATPAAIDGSYRAQLTAPLAVALASVWKWAV